MSTGPFEDPDPFDWRHDLPLRYCICADPDQCTEPVEGRVCRKLVKSALGEIPRPREIVNENAKSSELISDPIDRNHVAERWGWTRWHLPPETQG